MTRRLSRSAVIAVLHLAAVYFAVVANSVFPDSAYPSGYRPDWIVVLLLVQLRLPGMVQWLLTAIVALMIAGLSTQSPGVVVGVIGLQLFALQYCIAYQLERRSVLFSIIVAGLAASTGAAFVLVDSVNQPAPGGLNWQAFFPAMKTGLATAGVIFPWLAVYAWWVMRRQRVGVRAAVIRNAWPMLSGR